MSTASFQVVYDGPALANSAIDVRDLAPALLAIGKLIEEANACLNGERAKIHVCVNASFKTGSFGIDFQVIQSFFDMAIDLFSSDGVIKAKEILEMLGLGSTPYAAYIGLLKLIKWLKGRKISKVTLLDDGKVRITVDGSPDVLEAELKIVEMLRNHNLMKELRKVFAPLEHEGIEMVTFLESGKSVEHGETITKEDVAYFMPPEAKQEPLPDKEEIMTLQLVSVSFRGENKWRFTDGISIFYAGISDEAFLRRVQNAEVSFSAGDVLDVRMHKRHWIDGDAMKSDYKVMEVLKHIKKATQPSLPFDDT